MPEYVSEDKTSFFKLRINLQGRKRYDEKQAFVMIHFRKRDLQKHRSDVAQRLGISSQVEEATLDLDETGLAAKLFDGVHKIGHHACWFPFKGDDPHKKYEYRQEAGKIVNPIYPAYVISKGRWKTRLTVKALDAMHVPYRMVIEPQEYDQYAAVIDSSRILTLPPEIAGSGCSIPARNWVWQHSISEGFKRHWLLDDNIQYFTRTNHNLGIRCETGAIFRAVEQFADRYENVALTGMQNAQFMLAKCKRPAFSLNTRVYSATLILNDLSLPTPEGDHWRGRYNEDTDLCIRALKAGWCTVLFNTFNIKKTTTMKMSGGNSDILYAGDPRQEDSGRHKMALSLKAQHPDVVKVSWRFNRWQHVADYSACAAIGNKAVWNGCVLKLKPGIKISKNPDEFGMVLQTKGKQ